MISREQTIEILKQAIKGTRIGLETPVYLHSVAVGDILQKYGFSEDIQYGGYLHDIVEDGGYTFQQLRELGYTEKTIHLVDLSTHDVTEGDARKAWEDMIARMIKEEDADVWAVKLADIMHNLTECHNCTVGQVQGYLFVKAPAFIYYGNKYFGGSAFYNEFVEIYREQVRRYHKYFSA